MTSDRVSVLGIQAQGTHGVFAHEKRDGQVFRCDVTLHLDTRRAAERDDLAEAVDYGGVAGAVHAVLAGPSFDLVETVAAQVAVAVLGGDGRIGAVDVTIHKPQAPVTVPFDDVAVTVHRTRADLLAVQPPDGVVRAAVALGSNLGDRAAFLRGAVHGLDRADGVTVVAVSPVVESDPVGGPEQDSYLNAVVIVETTRSPLSLLHLCQDVEQLHGRRRLVRWGPRTLDIDLLAYGDVVLDTETLTLPHPRAGSRGFVVVPWHLVEPHALLPGPDRPVPVAEVVARLSSAVGAVPGVHVRDDLRLTVPSQDLLDASRVGP